MLKSICYISNKNSNIIGEHLDKLLHSIISRNNSLNITGVLLLQNDHFFQIMEGDSEIIDEIFRKIEDDERHHGMIKLLDQPISDRIFEDYESGLFSVVSDYRHLKKLRRYFDWIKMAGLVQIDQLIELTNNFLNYNK